MDKTTSIPTLELIWIHIKRLVEVVLSTFPSMWKVILCLTSNVGMQDYSIHYLLFSKSFSFSAGN